MAGYAINYLTPTAAMGGEVTKSALLAANHRGPEAASGVLIGKVCFAFAHLLFVVIGTVVCLWRIDLPRALWVAMSVSGGLIGSGMLAFLMIQKHGKLGSLVRWFASRKLGGTMVQKMARDISKVDEALKAFYRERPGDLVRAVCWHQLGYSLGILQTWLFLHLLHQEASWGLAAGLWFLGMWFDLLTFAVPMNVGTLEGTRILALRAIGYSSLVGMTYGLALRLAQLFWSAVGLAIYGFLVRSGGAVSACSCGLESAPRPVGRTRSVSGREHEQEQEWIGRRRSRPSGGLDFAELCREAMRKEGLEDFGSPPLTPALPLLIESLEREADLHPRGRFLMRIHLRDLLATRLKLAEIWKANSAKILGQPVLRPIFIVGMPRSGSTFLHELLAADPVNRAPRVWEVMYPVHTGSQANAIFKTECSLWCFRWLVPEADSVYPMRARTPHECVAIHSYTFLSEEFISTCRIPAYKSFLRTADLTPAYEWEKRLLQHLQTGCPARRWVLKSPDHVYGLEALFATFPDAFIVQTHRDPVQVLASSAQLTQALRGLYGRPGDQAATLAAEIDALAEGTERLIQFRDSHPELADRFIDIKYPDLVADPLSVVAQIYDGLGACLSNTTQQSIGQLAASRSRYRGPRASASTSRFHLKEVLDPARFERYCLRFCPTNEDANGN